MPGRTEKKRRHGTYTPPFKGGKRGQNAQNAGRKTLRHATRRVCPRTIYPPPSLPLTCTYTCIQGRISDTSTRRHLSGPLLFPRQRRINRLFYSSNVKSILHRVVRQDGGGGVHKERRRERERERRRRRGGDRRMRAMDVQNRSCISVYAFVIQPRPTSLPRHT